MDVSFKVLLIGMICTLLGTAVGALPPIIITLINKRYEERRALRELIIKTGLENYKHMFEIAKDQGGGSWIVPVDDFIVHMLLVSEKLLHKKLTPEEIKATVANIRTIMREIRAKRAANPG